MHNIPKKPITTNSHNFIYEELLDFCKSICTNHRLPMGQTLCFITEALSKTWLCHIAPEAREQKIKEIGSLFIECLNEYSKFLAELETSKTK